MIFETKRLYVTKWKSDDLLALHELYNDAGITESIVPPSTIEETKFIFEDQLNNYNSNVPFGRYFIVEKESNEFIGILLFKKDIEKDGVEIGYSLMKDYWKKGYATEVVKESIDWIFESKEYSSISAVTDQQNENSKNVLLKCGFLPGVSFTDNGEEMNLFGLLKKDVSILQ